MEDRMKPEEPEQHIGGAWKVAYADFVTALMALFIVLWLVSSGREVRESVAGYFRDPRGFHRLTGSALLLGAGVVCLAFLRRKIHA